MTTPYPHFIFKRIHTESKKNLTKILLKGGNIFIKRKRSQRKKGEKMEFCQPMRQKKNISNQSSCILLPFFKIIPFASLLVSNCNNKKERVIHNHSMLFHQTWYFTFWYPEREYINIFLHKIRVIFFQNGVPEQIQNPEKLLNFRSKQCPFWGENTLGEKGHFPDFPSCSQL